MLGAPGTRVYVGEGPLVDRPPHHRLDGHPEPSCPLVLVRRKSATATYAAVHEPYSDRPSIRATRGGEGVVIIDRAVGARIGQVPDTELKTFPSYRLIVKEVTTALRVSRTTAFRQDNREALRNGAIRLHRERRPGGGAVRTAKVVERLCRTPARSQGTGGGV